MGSVNVVCLDAAREWLSGPGRFVQGVSELLMGLCRTLVEGGLPLRRVNLALHTLHPEMVGTGYTWQPGLEHPHLRWLPRGEYQTERYLSSPLPFIAREKRPLRRRLEGEQGGLDFSILKDLQSEGMTDYAVFPLLFTNGQAHALSLATGTPGGFADECLQALESLLPMFSALLEVHETRRMTATLLGTYLGQRTGEEVLRGHIVRGEGQRLEAALWFCDLCNFTSISATVSPALLVELLNAYFDCMAEAVHERGGEILKFIGDAMLAIFPIGPDLSRQEACRCALEAAQDALARLQALSLARAEENRIALRGDIALHVGNVMYGNIGSRLRLDFTVIGPAVNLLSRLEKLCGERGCSLVFSRDFALELERPMVSLGTFQFKGVPEPQEVFTLAPTEPPG
jgi:adenylate cyclase